MTLKCRKVTGFYPMVRKQCIHALLLPIQTLGMMRLKLTGSSGISIKDNNPFIEYFMKINFWNERWKQNQTGFHQSTASSHLVNYWPAITSNQAKVFVPLCGKSLDLLWLMDHGHQVTGVECSALAVGSFFDENNLQYEKNADKSFSIFENSQITIFQGDYFDLNKSYLSDVEYVFDRASLIALPEDMRQRYSQHMTQLLNSAAQILLVTLEYDQHLMQGPPFSVSEEEVNALYGSYFLIKKFHQQDVIDKESRFKANGLDALIETVYCLQKL